jgi:pimeloyl-ACP methyl ester carboxylesterase
MLHRFAVPAGLARAALLYTRPEGPLRYLQAGMAMTVQEGSAGYFVSAPDGLRLHARSYGARDRRRTPVVCLPGLARTTADFDTLAKALANDPDRARHVLAIDYRGRGESEYDRDPANYSIATEVADLIAILTAIEIEPAVLVGTSRGGILAMVLATVRPTAIAGVVLNDIGPVIETRGLVRIKSYLGRLPQPKSLDDAADILRHLFAAQFPKLGPDDWTAFARRTFKEQDGSFKPRYDPKLAEALKTVDMARSVPPLWKEFDALASVPVMVVRGANSDVLAAETVAAMRARRPDLVALEVPDQGHAPLLAESAVIAEIGTFIARC